jgi:hypothetical protein
VYYDHRKASSLATLLMWCDVLPVVAKFVLICQQKNLNFLSDMQTYCKMLADLEVLTAGGALLNINNLFLTWRLRSLLRLDSTIQVQFMNCDSSKQLNVKVAGVLVLAFPEFRYHSHTVFTIANFTICDGDSPKVDSSEAFGIVFNPDSMMALPSDATDSNLQQFALKLLTIFIYLLLKRLHGRRR